MLQGTDSIEIYPLCEADQMQAQCQMERWGGVIVQAPPTDRAYLQQADGGLSLVFPTNPQWQPLQVDFTTKAWRYRLQHASWRKEQVARAVGLGSNASACVFDATAGIGQDTFILAHLGAEVVCTERSPVIAALLDDGLVRAQAAGLKAADRITLCPGGAIKTMQAQACQPDMVYLDPMYPGREEQSARQKKSLRMLRDIVGEDLDAAELLQPALQIAKKRVVVKRPKGAGYLADVTPQFSQTGSSSRFDIYLVAS